MKNIKLLLSVILFMSFGMQELIGKEPNISTNVKKGEKMESNNILSDEDSFYGLKIEGSQAGIVVTLNGMEVFRRMKMSQFNTFIPVNQYIYSGKNKIKVKLYSSKIKISQIANCKVSLILVNKKYKVNQALSVINFDNNASKDKFKGSSSEGQRNGIVDIYSPMAISQIELIEGIWQFGEKVGANVTQMVTLATTFPRWKFIDSEIILGKSIQEFDSKTYEESKSLPKIKALYDANSQIIEMIKNKKVKELMTLLKERNEEMDKAFGDPIGSTEKELFYHLNKAANDASLEVFENKKPFYFVEDNDKVGYIMDSLIFNKKDKSGSESYTFKFRYEKGKWIVTR